MIVLQLLAATIATAPAPPLNAAHDLIAGAEHAIHVNRLDQASVMASRALAAGAKGRDMDRLSADLAFAKGQFADALARYSALLKSEPRRSDYLEHAGISALKLGEVSLAYRYLSAATSSARPTWRAWNALGVAADMRSEWSKADACYTEAALLAPDEFEPLNNHGWSLVLRGKWSIALPLFQRAVALQPKSVRARDNLDLASAALGPNLPERRPDETDAAWAARLNDAGLAAMTVGDKARATSAFTQALEVSGTWYSRAANNLKAIANR